MTPVKKRLLAKLNTSRKVQRTKHKQLKRLRNKETNISKEMVMCAIKSMLPENVSSFECMQLKHAYKKKMPWTEEEKLQALAMRYVL